MSTVVLLANLAATLYMTGLIWFVQIVHYPLFSAVGTEQFARYEVAHTRLVTLVVAPPMLLELLTTFALFLYPPRGATTTLLTIAAGLVLLNWLSTVLLQIPQHNTLVGGFDETAHHSLVVGNWVRTAAWTARGALMLWITGRSL